MSLFLSLGHAQRAVVEHPQILDRRSEDILAIVRQPEQSIARYAEQCTHSSCSVIVIHDELIRYSAAYCTAPILICC